MMIKRKELIVVLLLLFIILGLRFLPIKNWISLEFFSAQKEYLQWLVQNHYIASVFTFIFVYILFVALAIPGVAVLTMASGVLFGIFPALIYVNIATTVGSLITFLLSRFYFGEWVQRRYAKQLVHFNMEFERRGSIYLMFMRLQPFLHIFIENALAGITRVSITTFIWTTMVGVLPGTLLLIIFGMGMAKFV